MAAKTRMQMEANLGSPDEFLGAQVGLHFGGGLGGQEAPIDIFLSAQDEWEEPRADFMGPRS